MLTKKGQAVMNSEFVLTQGAGQKLEFAVNRNGGSTTDIDWLSEKENFKTVMLIARGQAKVSVVVHIIDCDANPFVPSGLTVESHKKGGQVKIERRGDDLFINDRKIELVLSKRQVGGKTVKGYLLRDEMTKREVLNACVLDYLLAHPELIPESWKKDEQGRARFIFFWGTIYRSSDGSLFVRCLCWGGGAWYSDCDWLCYDWDGQAPAAVVANEN